MQLPSMHLPAHGWDNFPPGLQVGVSQACSMVVAALLKSSALHRNTCQQVIMKIWPKSLLTVEIKILAEAQYCAVLRIDGKVLGKYRKRANHSSCASAPAN